MPVCVCVFVEGVDWKGWALGWIEVAAGKWMLEGWIEVAAGRWKSATAWRGQVGEGWVLVDVGDVWRGNWRKAVAVRRKMKGRIGGREGTGKRGLVVVGL